MTPGQYLFFGGLGLLALTLIMGVIFLIKKPKYEPEGAVGAGGTEKLHSGYPTDRLTVRRPAPDSSAPQGPAGVQRVSQGTTPLEQGTTPLEQGTTPLERGTTPLEQGTVPLEQGTTPLAAEGGSQRGGTTLLNQ